MSGGPRAGWVQPTDGILVLDKNNNGKIDNVGELFGGQGTSGFAALAAYDLNGDGVIDASDAVYSQLRVWQDANGNAVADPGELHTLASLGIASINVAGTAQTGVSVAGNQVTAAGTLTRTGGSTGSIGNVTFTTDPFNSHYLGNTTISPQAAAEPNLKGYGTLADLRVAMTLDPILVEWDSDDRAHGAFTEVSLASNTPLLLSNVGRAERTIGEGCSVW